MSIITNCPECSSKLSVPDSLLGKMVRCTKCKATFVANEDGVASSGSAGTPPPLPEETGYRAREDVLARRESGDTYEDRPSRRPPPRDDYDDDDDDRPRRRRRRDYDDDYEDYRQRAPHRGGTVLTMGIFSIVLCCIPIAGIGLGAGAINMANTDIKQMDSGRMDSSGRGSTESGRICGTIGCVLSGILAILGCLLRFQNLK